MFAELTVHGIRGGGVAIQAPPQVDKGQAVVGVQVEPVGQPVVTPTVQGMLGGGVKMDKQSPPQVIVCVQVDPVGQG